MVGKGIPANHYVYGGQNVWYCNIKEITSTPDGVTANAFGFLLVLVVCIHIRNFTYASCSHFVRLCVLEPVITVLFVHPVVLYRACLGPIWIHMVNYKMVTIISLN